MSDEKYFIDTDRRIGKGATASVFIGIRKVDGELFALKCSNLDLNKEINISKNLEHKNIVKFYESVKLDTYQNVLVMEYCNKGSLYDFIEIHKGLCDNMFLKTLECLSDGVQYLRENSVIHRDIKPGNMMVHMDSLGYFHIKLGDMGAAKKVADNQMFMTLVGTREYLHPDMYIRYVEGLEKEHSVNVDLWSIGVTLFHAAATELPFLPFMYSRNNEKSKDVMKHIYNNMPKGVVWGRQSSDDLNDIEWHYNLPKKCRMSPMLMKLAANLIAQLFGSEISYDVFFKEADKILKKKRVLVFTPNNGLLQFLYLDLLTYENIMAEACRIQKLEPNEIVLFTCSKRIESTPDNQYEIVQDIPVKGHLHYTLTDNTVFIMPTVAAASKAGTESTNLIPLTIPDDFSEPLEEYIEIDQRVKYSVNLMKIIYQIGQQSNYLECQVACYEAVMKSYSVNIAMETVKKLFEMYPWRFKLILSECNKADNVVKCIDKFMTIQPDSVLEEKRQNILNDSEKLRKNVNTAKSSTNEYYEAIFVKRKLLNFIANPTSLLNYSNEKIDHMVYKAEELLAEIRMLPDYNPGGDCNNIRLKIWTRHIQQFKLYEQAKKCFVKQNISVKQLYETYDKWLKQSNGVMTRISGLQDYMISQEKRRDNLYHLINISVDNINIGSSADDFQSIITQEKMEKIKAELEILKKHVNDGNL